MVTIVNNALKIARILFKSAKKTLLTKLFDIGNSYFFRKNVILTYSGLNNVILNEFKTCFKNNCPGRM